MEKTLREEKEGPRAKASKLTQESDVKGISVSGKGNSSTTLAKEFFLRHILT